MKRTLKLKKEVLDELSTEELRRVAGGAELSGTTCPVKDCVNSRYNCPPTFRDSCLPTCYCTPATG